MENYAQEHGFYGVKSRMYYSFRSCPMAVFDIKGVATSSSATTVSQFTVGLIHKDKEKGRSDGNEEEKVSSYWMTLWTRDDTGELALKEAVDFVIVIIWKEWKNKHITLAFLPT
jgi:hypothetical protein